MSNEEQQELIIEMRVKVKTPKIATAKLAEGIKRIIINQWPQCSVSLEEIQMISVASAGLTFRKAQEGNDEEQEEA